MKLTYDLLERVMGMDVFLTNTPGIGGTIRERPEDFIVEEIQIDGSLASSRPIIKDTESTGDYFWIVLGKKGIDTETAISKLAKAIGIPRSYIQVAGLKDSRAVTYQFVSCYGIDEKRILSLPNTIDDRISIGLVIKRPFPIRPGLLFGNRFTIVIRNIRLSIDVLNHRMEMFLNEVEEYGGIPAFYGHQRFGTIRPNTHIIGYYIIKRDFRRAVEELITTTYPNESAQARAAREEASEGNLERALELMPKSLTHERIVLRYLLRRPNDFVGAIRRLPLTTKRLFVQSYQSYIFNRILSLRLLRGLSLRYPEEGDRVSLIDSRGGLRGSIIVTSANKSTFLELIEKGRSTLVLPLIGYTYTPSSGVQGEIEREVLEIEGIDNALFKIPEIPELSLKGGIRPAAFKPLEIQVMSLSHDELHPGKYKLTLKFTLKKGLYATTLLRELMKPDDVFKAGF